MNLHREIVLLGHDSSVFRFRLTIGIATSCTPPFYLREESCGQFCQARDDQLGHYTCTPNGDKECLPGTIIILSK